MRIILLFIIIFSLNCQSCNKSNGYYQVEDFLPFELCKQKDEIGYYLDENASILKLCYRACKTCLKGGNDTHHNCETCKDDYFLDGKNCFSECSKDLFISDNGECVANCKEKDGNSFAELLSKTCVKICPDGMKKSEKDGLCIIERTSVYADYDREKLLYSSI